jgi:hypothetical protein
MPIRYVLVKLKPGVTVEDYERFIRTVDYPVIPSLKTIRHYRTQRIRPEDKDPESFDWDYMERIDITEIDDYRRELDASEAFGEFRRLQPNYVERQRSFWAEVVEP